MAKKRNRRERRERNRNRLPRTAPPVSAEKLHELEGRRDSDNQGEGIFPAERVETLGEASVTDIYEAELEAGDSGESLDLLTERELRSGETDDAFEATEEGLTYVPPTDPPTVPGGRDNAEVASGFGGSSLDEPYDGDHHDEFLPDDDEMTARVREALLADSSTSIYADQVAIVSSGGRIVLRGSVDDLIDAENLIAVANDVTGVSEVADQLEVRALRRGR